MEKKEPAIKNLIEELNRVVKSYGYRRVREITIDINSIEEINYKTTTS